MTAPTCPAKGLTRSDIPCNSVPFVAKHCTDRPTPDGDVHGYYRHVIMYASRINVVAGAVRVTAQAAQVPA